MHIKSISIENYKSFLVKTNFSFQPGFNVLLGANSSGKSSVLEAIELSKFGNQPHRSILNIVEPDTKWPATSIAESAIELSLQDLLRELVPANEAAISIGEHPGQFHSNNLAELTNNLANKPFELRLKQQHGAGQFGQIAFPGWNSAWRSFSGGPHFPAAILDLNTKSFTSITNLSKGPEDLVAFWNSIAERTYRFSADRRVEPVSGHSTPRLQPNCANLAYCINWLQSNDVHLFEQLNQFVHRVFPIVHWIGAPPNGGNQFELKVHMLPTREMRGDLAVSISQVGTGIFNALAMLYVVLTARTSQFILLEEPNSFLHPRALRELLAILSEVGGRHQFFVTTHSSDVLRTIEASTVTLLEYDGRTTTFKQNSGAALGEFRTGLLDLGIRLTDLHGCDFVLWVEGETEEAVFPSLLRHFFQDKAQGIAVLPLHATGDFEAKRMKPAKVAEIYKKLSQSSFLVPPMVAIALDREKRSKSDIDATERGCAGVVHFLPRPMLEDYFLHADAIAYVINSEFSKSIESADVKRAMEDAATHKENRLFPEREGDLTLHAASTLNSIFRQLGGAGAEYRKTAHGLKLANWILTNEPKHFTELKDWIGTVIQ